MILPQIAPALLAVQAPPPVVYLVETRVREARVGGTAAQATALVKTPAYEGWSYRARYWTVSDKPPTGLPAADPAATRATWDANPGLDLRFAIPEADLIGSPPASPPEPPPLRLVGNDPALGDQLRFELCRRDLAGSPEDVQALLAAVTGRQPLGRWDAARALLTPWTKPTVSATWPKP